MNTLKFNGQCDSCPRPLMGAVDWGGTGYASDDLGRRHCYECCVDHDRARMRAGKPIVSYLMERGTASRRCVTNWPGSLSILPTHVRKSQARAFGHRIPRYDVWFTFGGRKWHGVNQGDNQILRCKQLKG